MAKSADPVQAARKAAVKREAKRNRDRKQQAHEARTLRQDTGSLERHIQRLESRNATLDQEGQEELQRLQKEVADVKRVKEEYIRKHPEQRNFVRGYEEPSSSSDTAKGANPSNGSLKPPPPSSPSQIRSGSNATAQTTARDPRWSIYYDAIFNPYGAPPPGMPYLTKPHAQLVQEGLVDVAKPPPLPEETADLQGFGSDDDSDSSLDGDLKDIVMPAGPPPIRMFTNPQHSSGNLARGPSQAVTSSGRHTASRGGRGRGFGPRQHQGGRQGPNFAQGEGARPSQGPSGLPSRLPSGLPVRPPPMTTANPSQPRQPGPPGPPPAVPDGVVISAEPQLRNLKKESTAFVPAAIRKKQQEEKARSKRGLPGRIDAAPISNDMSDSSSASASYQDRPDLLKSVQAHLPPKQQNRDSIAGSGSKKDYDRFLDEVGDLL